MIINKVRQHQMEDPIKQLKIELWIRDHTKGSLGPRKNSLMFTEETIAAHKEPVLTPMPIQVTLLVKGDPWAPYLGIKTVTKERQFSGGIWKTERKTVGDWLKNCHFQKETRIRNKWHKGHSNNILVNNFTLCLPIVLKTSARLDWRVIGFPFDQEIPGSNSTLTTAWSAHTALFFSRSAREESTDWSGEQRKHVIWLGKQFEVYSCRQGRQQQGIPKCWRNLN